jgi:catalase
MAARSAPLAEEIVDALNEVYGRHEGHRAMHAKGSLCSGRFAATPEAAAMTRAAHLQGEPMRVHVRLSNAGGNPGAHDGDILVFDPSRLTDGIELSDDSILPACEHAHAEPVLRRSGVAREPA